MIEKYNETETKIADPAVETAREPVLSELHTIKARGIQLFESIFSREKMARQLMAPTSQTLVSLMLTRARIKNEAEEYHRMGLGFYHAIHDLSQLSCGAGMAGIMTEAFHIQLESDQAFKALDGNPSVCAINSMTDPVYLENQLNALRQDLNKAIEAATNVCFELRKATDLDHARSLISHLNMLDCQFAEDSSQPEQDSDFPNFFRRMSTIKAAVQAEKTLRIEIVETLRKNLAALEQLYQEIKVMIKST